MTDRPARILVVSAQFPYPPSFGFATRVYHLTRQLAARHDVTLLSYLHDDELDALEDLRKELDVEVVSRDRDSVAATRTSQLLSIASRRPFECRRVSSNGMQRAIDQLCAERSISAIQIESSVLGGFRLPAHTRIVLDEHNIEYEVLERLHLGERSVLRRSFNRLEHGRFRSFERRLWQQVDGCVVTSDREEAIVRHHAPNTPTAVVANGVDLEYFRPGTGLVEDDTAVFTGLLGYRPNLDAALHLVDDVWPLVERRRPGCRLTIIGRGAESDLRRLRRPNVTVTGGVADVRPYIERAAVVVVPVRMGGGTRLKVVEGLAMGKAMVSTTVGCEGVNVRNGEHLLIADTAMEFADKVVHVFSDRASAMALGRSARRLIEEEYSWDLAGARLGDLYRRLPARA